MRSEGWQGWQASEEEMAEAIRGLIRRAKDLGVAGEQADELLAIEQIRNFLTFIMPEWTRKLVEVQKKTPGEPI